MENELHKTPSFTPKPPPPLPENRGAGGKFRKQPPRRPHSTPYARPPQNQSQPRGGGRWFSRLVDPAYRLISGGASLILPSLFSKSASTNDLSPPSGDEEDKLQKEEEQNTSGGDGNFTYNHQEHRTTGVAGTSKISDRSNTHSNFNGLELNQKVDDSNPNEISEILQLMKDNRFSRDEINHLIEILNSRVVDIPEAGQENKGLDTTAVELREPAHAPENSRKLTDARGENLNGATWDTSKINPHKFSSAISADAGSPVNVLENSRKSTEGKHQDLDRFLLKPSTPLLQSKLHDGIGTSPIDLARAYMENRTSEVVFGSDSSISKDKGTVPCNDERVLKPYIPSPAAKSSPCWPGASVQDQQGYMTPQSQRRRFGLHNLPRTPYSRSIYTKTNSRSIQLQANPDRHRGMISTPFQHTPAQSLGQMNSRGITLNDGHGSSGPVRRLRHKFVEETPRRSPFIQTTANGGQLENVVSEGLFSAPLAESRGMNSTSKFLLIGGKPEGSEVSGHGNKKQSSEVRVPTVPAHSSQVARKILEHLDRNPPTPKDKSAELRLATAWQKPHSSDLAIFMPNKQSGLTRLNGGSSEKSCQVRNINSHLSDSNNNVSTSDLKLGAASTLSDCVGPSQDLRYPQDSLLMNASKDDASKVRLTTAGSGGSSLQKLPPQSSNNKPVLPPIAITNANQKWKFSSDNGVGFTFPSSAVSGGSSEPPTPSILPSTAVISQPQKSEGASGQLRQNERPSGDQQLIEKVPSYSFGSRSAPRLVFSFPSTSNTSTLDNASDLKFKFGSEDTKRISFSSLGKDAICC